MAVDDNYREVIRKSGAQVNDGDNAEYKLRTFLTDEQIEQLANKVRDVDLPGLKTITSLFKLQFLETF